ncbi:signal transduction histidine kinase [Mycena alexandri]|uniref:Signal transduction histidine kinase n=1 Tax=Mycena alexandri TaxID=1745969 RepID=A0AAD6XDD6_9AGAR|nr:signal transduction histidine kinase [Mycena alexandri]
MTPIARVGSDSAGTIDVAAFNQILDLDDDDTHAYSKDMIVMYFAQAPKAFAEMDAALAATDLRTLADLAHFLMGSSAALGIARVAATCARMEGVGEASLKAGAAAAEGKDPGRAGALEQIGALLREVKREYADAETWLRRWYTDHGQKFDEAKPPETEEAAEGSGLEPKSDIAEAVDAPPQPPPKNATSLDDTETSKQPLSTA